MWAWDLKGNRSGVFLRDSQLDKMNAKLLADLDLHLAQSAGPRAQQAGTSQKQDRGGRKAKQG